MRRGDGRAEGRRDAPDIELVEQARPAGVGGRGGGDETDVMEALLGQDAFVTAKLHSPTQAEKALKISDKIETAADWKTLVTMEQDPGTTLAPDHDPARRGAIGCALQTVERGQVENRWKPIHPSVTSERVLDSSSVTASPSTTRALRCLRRRRRRPYDPDTRKYESGLRAPAFTAPKSC